MVEFFDMGGYGFYIWISYGVFAIMLGYNYFAPLRRHKKLIQALSRFYRRQ
ncbi:heme exporter protein CcmD [Candidatus Spongiihabitans sp.]|uniref:heme exporter protein CcmD n=1 Tax=Candidatus Spongiihabitans sp. TaxID=3101308 RepID=UPI003C7DBBAA